MPPSTMYSALRARRALAILGPLVLFPTCLLAASPPPTLPDSVLAVVGDGPPITTAQLVAEWGRAHPGQPPDSLTPQAARGFLDLLVDREIITREALRKPASWTGEDSAGFLLLRDRLTMQAVLQRALEEAHATRKALGDSAWDAEVLGIVARDSAVVRLGTVFDEPLIERISAAWKALPRPVAGASLADQVRALEVLPALSSDDLARPLAQSSSGEYLVADLFAAWKRLSPAYRYRIENSEQLRDLVRNGLYERLLRRSAADLSPDQHREITVALAAERERIAVRHFVDREVTERIDVESADLQKLYRDHAEEWKVPMRVLALRLSASNRADADRLGLTLRNAAAAETLATRARRRGVDYEVEVSAADDSALFFAARAVGTGAVVGPLRSGDEWWVARVLAVLPARDRRFAEVRETLAARWTAAETERLVRRLCDRLRSRTRIVIDDRKLVNLFPPPLHAPEPANGPRGSTSGIGLRSSVSTGSPGPK